MSADVAAVLPFAWVPLAGVAFTALAMRVTFGAGWWSQ
jgi:hypothetical protein